MSKSGLFSSLLQAVNKARGLGAGFRGNVPRNFSPLGQAASTAPSIGRPALSSTGTKGILGYLPGGGNVGGFSKPGLGSIYSGGMTAAGAYGVVDNLRKGNTEKAAISAMMMVPAKYLAGAAGMFAVSEGLAPRKAADGTMAGAPTLTPQQQKAAAEAQKALVDSGAVRPVAGSTAQQMTGLEAVQVPPGGPIRPDRETPNINPVTTENGAVTTPISTPAPKPDPGMASTPEENAGAMDPYAYQLQVYGQGRQAASSQEAEAAVRDLGLSIHQKLYRQFYADKDNVPTTDAQLPNSMNMKDANAELYASTLAVEELIDPKILEQLNAMNLRKTGY
jgi:hypothetical protein